MTLGTCASKACILIAYCHDEACRHLGQSRGFRRLLYENSEPPWRAVRLIAPPYALLGFLVEECGVVFAPHDLQEFVSEPLQLPALAIVHGASLMSPPYARNAIGPVGFPTETGAFGRGSLSDQSVLSAACPSVAIERV